MIPDIRNDKVFMEQIIATEIPPNGLDQSIIDYIVQNELMYSLESSILYYGFPIFRDYEDETVKSQIVLLSPNHGLILFHSSAVNLISDDDETLTEVYSFVEASLRKSKLLRKNRSQLSFHLEGFLFVDNFNESLQSDFDNPVISSLAGIGEKLTELSSIKIDDEYIDEIRSILEGAKALSRKSKRIAKSDDLSEKLNILIELENEISNFDIEQRKIAINLNRGPQRIRGLAGSGKTVILAMKAAQIHIQNPSQKILFTFYTKSLYGIIIELITKFYRHFTGDEPNWEVIHVLHAWGGKTIDGVYYNLCYENEISALNFSDARRINYSDPFSEVCKNALSFPIRSKYDHILIDEAQDLPNSFFNCCYYLAKGDIGSEKNIVWAYDELQSIFNIYQRSPKELFGTDESGQAKIDLDTFKSLLPIYQSNDIVFYKCYRNPLEILVTAHAVGLGVYSEKPIQLLENKEHWEDVGYEFIQGDSLEIGSEVIVERKKENSPLSIYKYQDKSDVLKVYQAENFSDELNWLTKKVIESIDQGLEPHDIMIICLDDINAKSYFASLSLRLNDNNVRSNNLLASSSVAPEFKLEGMVTFTTVHRAKGNEAAEVIAIGIDSLFQTKRSRSTRNKLFTAFTRTKAWLSVSGIGSQAKYFLDEIQISLENSPKIHFTVPDQMDPDIEQIDRDHNDSPQEYIEMANLLDNLRKKGVSDTEIAEQLQMKLKLENKMND